MSTTAVGKGIDLDSREYKLMLEVEHFSGDTPQRAVDLFFRDQLVPAVRTSFGAKAADELAEKGVELDERRIVRFWDTETCGLNGHGFALRERVDLDADDRPASEREITLKYRGPDLFLVAGTRLPAADVEGAVLDHIQKLLAAPELVARTRAAAKREVEDEITEREVTILLADFATVWNELFPAEQARIVQLLVERVDLREDALEVRIRADGLASLVGDQVRLHPARAG